MINTVLHPTPPTNPVVLDQCFLWFNEKTDTHLRVVVLTADDIPTPYYLIQIYQTRKPDKYILNFAIYPNIDALHEIRSGMLTSMDLIVGGLRHTATSHKVFNVLNGEEYLDALYAGLDVLDKLISVKLDPIIIAWLNNQGH